MLISSLLIAGDVVGIQTAGKWCPGLSRWHHCHLAISSVSFFIVLGIFTITFSVFYANAVAIIVKQVRAAPQGTCSRVLRRRGGAVAGPTRSYH